MEAMDKTTRMLTEPVSKLINHLALPTIVSMLVTSIYNMADTFFVARLNSESATAAVGVVFAVMALIQAIGFFCGHGSGNYMSRMLGAGKTEHAEKMAVTGFTMALILGSCLMIFGLLFLEPLARLLGSTETMLPYAKAYMSWILVGAPWMCAALVMNNQLRFQGNAFFSMIGITAGGILNIFLDPLFIFTFDLGIAGAAIATILSQFISFCLLFIGVLRSDSVKYHVKNISINKYYIQQMFKGGLPSLCRQGLSSVSTAILNLCTAPFGDAAIAGISIVTRVMQFCFSVVIGFGQGFQPVCGYNYGARKFDRVKEGFWFVVKVGCAFCLVVSVVAFIFAPQILVFFQGGEPLVVEVGTAALRFQCISFTLTVFITMANMMLQVTGQTLGASILAAARQGITLVPCIILLPHVFGLGLFGVEIAQMCADILAFAIAVPFVKQFFDHINEKETV